MNLFHQISNNIQMNMLDIVSPNIRPGQFEYSARPNIRQKGRIGRIPNSGRIFVTSLLKIYI